MKNCRFSVSSPFLIFGRIILVCILFAAVPAFAAGYKNPENKASSRSTIEMNAGVYDKIRAFADLQNRLLREHIYVHTDREAYFTGDRIWFSAYVRSGPYMNPSQVSRVLYAELYSPDGDLVDRTLVRIEQGRASGTLFLNNDEGETVHGTYSLVAYTLWSYNFGESFVFTKLIDVYDEAAWPLKPAESIADRSLQAISVYPESAALVPGFNQRVAFQGKNDEGYPALIDYARLTDRFGNVLIDSISSDANGRGYFEFIPEAYGLYRLESGNIRVRLQEAEPDFFALRLDKNEANQISLSLLAGEEITEAPVLFAHNRGRVVYTGNMVRQDDRWTIWVSPDVVGAGFVHFTAVSKDGRLLAERSHIIPLEVQRNSPQLSIESDKQLYGNRERVALNLRLTNGEGQPVSGSASISVYDADMLQSTRNYPEIRSSLTYAPEWELSPFYTLDSGALHFNSEENLRDQFLLGMMHPNTAYGFFYDPIRVVQFAPEQGMWLSGTARTGLRGRPADGAVIFFSLDDEETGSYIAETDAEGFFEMPHADFMGRRLLKIRANDSQGRDNIRLRLNDQFAFLPNLGKATPQYITDDAELERYYEQASRADRGVEFESGDHQNDKNPARLIEAERAGMAAAEVEIQRDIAMFVDLEQVTVTATREEIEEMRIRFAQGDLPVSGGIIRFDENPDLRVGNIFAAVARLPGVRVSGNQVLIDTRFPGFREQTLPPLLLVDGIPADIGSLENINPDDIHSIAVLRRPEELARFGVRGGSGALSVRTRSGNAFSDANANITEVMIQGFEEKVPFFAPRYAGLISESDRVDTRITLHWAPELSIPQSGEGLEVVFWTGDIPSDYIVVVEGISSDGLPFRGEYMIRIE
ncbi:MAG: Plug domain-containing protein [Balneolales bacterium]|nr:Plug domain-containing protein [Balneolales bacterium]